MTARRTVLTVATVAALLLPACTEQRHKPSPTAAPTTSAPATAAPLGPDSYDLIWVDKVTGRTFGQHVDGTVVQLHPPAPLPDVGGLNLSPDGRRLAYPVAGDKVAVTTIDGFRQVTYDVPFSGRLLSPPDVVWSPDSGTLAITDKADKLEPGGVEEGGTTSGFFLLDITTGRTTRVAHTIVRDNLSWSPDGTRLAVSPPAGGVEVLDRTGTVVHRLPAPLTVAGSRAWSPDGTYLLVYRAGLVAIVSVTTGTRKNVLPVSDYVWRDASHVARFVYQPNKVEIIELRGLDGRPSGVFRRFDATHFPSTVAIRPAS